MRVDKLWLSDFKNLRDFSIRFDENELISVIVGRNGTGKSNIIEALVIIFRDLDLGKDPQFAYQLWYSIGNFTVHIDADPTRYNNTDKRRTKDFYRIKITDTTKNTTEQVTINKFAKDEQRRFLPRYVFGYYSGPSNRLEQHFEEHQNKFYQELIRQSSKKTPLLYVRFSMHDLSIVSLRSLPSFLRTITMSINFLQIISILLAWIQSCLFLKRLYGQTKRDNENISFGKRVVPFAFFLKNCITLHWLRLDSLSRKKQSIYTCTSKTGIHSRILLRNTLNKNKSKNKSK